MLKKLTKQNKFKKFLMSLPIMKKIQKDDSLFKLWSIAMERMRDNNDTSQEVALNEAVNFINSKVSLANNTSLWELQNLIRKGILKAEEISLGIDSRGRKMKRYKISILELETFIGLIQMFEVAENQELIERQKLQSTGEDIIVYYQTLSPKKTKISPVEVKMDMLFRLLERQDFKKFLFDLSEKSRA